MSRRRGFTLIELLVVIAIIAILAAILFPVFAQAREKARQTTCLSNFKQAAIAIAMYVQDFDEAMVPMQYGCCGYNPKLEMSWAQLVTPYVKNWGVHNCPTDPNSSDDIGLQQWADKGVTQNSPQREKEYAWGTTTDLGYNYLYLSPMSPAHPKDSLGNVIDFRGVSLASIQKPANCLMLADSIWDRDEGSGQPKGGGNWFIEAPSAWYSGTAYWFGGWRYTNNKSWLQYGGTWPRHNEMMNVAFVDGHCKAMRVTHLLAGVDPRTKQVFDRQAYVWGRD